MASWVTAPSGNMVNLDYVAHLQVAQDNSGYYVNAVSGGYAATVLSGFGSRAAAEAAMADLVLGRA